MGARHTTLVVYQSFAKIQAFCQPILPLFYLLADSCRISAIYQLGYAPRTEQVAYNGEGAPCLVAPSIVPIRSIMMFLNGTYPATIQQLQLVDIHGTRYVDITYTLAGQSAAQSARVGRDDVRGNPQPGDSVQMTFVMNVITGVQRATA